MSQKQIIELLDDLDGGAADETVVFGLDGRNYEIDLSAKNAKKLRRSLEEYAAVARRVSAKRTNASTRSRSSQHSDDVVNDAGIIREWAVSNGYAVSRRGRIPAPLRQAYEAR